jgi:hypothetical protein
MERLGIDRLRRWRRQIAAGAALAAGASVLDLHYSLPKPAPPAEIYRGVVYSCEEMPETSESGGLAHTVRADLGAPGIQLYFTPSEAPGVPVYRLERTFKAAWRENLAVAVNGALFEDRCKWMVPSDKCAGLETVISDHKVSHIDPNSYLLWFEDDLTPHLETEKPPPAHALLAAKWGIGGEGVTLHGGAVSEDIERAPDRRTLLGIAPPKKTLWLAVYEHASFYAPASHLAAQGATEAIAIDGGHSSTMVLGKDARGARPGTLMGGWRPVATHVGVRARPLP